MLKKINLVLTVVLILSGFCLGINFIKYLDMKNQISEAKDLLGHIIVDLEYWREDIYDLQRSHYILLSKNLQDEYVTELNGIEVAWKIEEKLPEHVYMVLDTFRQRMGLLYLDENIIIPDPSYKVFLTTSEVNELIFDSAYTTFDQLNGWYLYGTGSLVEDGFKWDTGMMDVLEWMNYENQFRINLSFDDSFPYVIDGELS